MREHKFKGKLMDKDEWVFGQLIMDENRTYLGYLKYLDSDVADPYFARVRPETVCQYLWRKDLDGVDVYEHDILKIITENHYVDYAEALWYGPEYPAFDLEGYYDECNSLSYIAGANDVTLKIIGNSIDSPRLLKSMPKSQYIGEEE